MRGWGLAHHMVQLQTCHNPQAALRASSPLKRGHEVVTCRGGYHPPASLPTTTAESDAALPGEILPEDARESSRRADAPNSVQTRERRNGLDFGGPIPGTYAMQF